MATKTKNKSSETMGLLSTLGDMNDRYDDPENTQGAGIQNVLEIIATLYGGGKGIKSLKGAAEIAAKMKKFTDPLSNFSGGKEKKSSELETDSILESKQGKIDNADANVLGFLSPNNTKAPAQETSEQKFNNPQQSLDEFLGQGDLKQQVATAASKTALGEDYKAPLTKAERRKKVMIEMGLDEEEKDTFNNSFMSPLFNQEQRNLQGAGGFAKGGNFLGSIVTSKLGISDNTQTAKQKMDSFLLEKQINEAMGQRQKTEAGFLSEDSAPINWDKESRYQELLNKRGN